MRDVDLTGLANGKQWSLVAGFGCFFDVFDAVPPFFGDGRFEHIVDGDDAQEVVVGIHDRHGDEVEVGHSYGDFGDVSVG